MNANDLRAQLAAARNRVAQLEDDLRQAEREERAARPAAPARDYWADHVKAVGEGRVYADDGYPVRTWPEY